MENLKNIIESAWNERSLLEDSKVREAIKEVIELLDKGKVRIAEKIEGEWIINEWLKKAVIMYFPINKMEVSESGIFEYYDKIPLKRGFEEAGVRVVPPAAVRHGAFINKGVILMPSYVNIGAYVDSGSMVDTWATEFVTKRVMWLSDNLWQAAAPAGSIVKKTTDSGVVLQAVLTAAGYTFDEVVKTTCFLADMNDFAAFNAVYEKYFVSKPARSCVAAAALPKAALVEVEVIAIH